MKAKVIEHKGQFLVKKGATYLNDGYKDKEIAQLIANRINLVHCGACGQQRKCFSLGYCELKAKHGG